MITWLLRCIVIVALLVLPVIGHAAGGHDSLSCTGCHSLHKAKMSSFVLAIQPNTKDINPRTKKPYEGTTAICLGCHQTSEKGGFGMTPISGHMSHPYGLTSINPKVATVPPQFLSNGRFECTSCHDPHPSNTNAKYLRSDVGGGSSMESFCAGCHPSKSDPKAAGGKGSAEEGKTNAGKKK